MLKKFRNIEREDVLPTVQGWEGAGELWHFHVLTPTCVFNSNFGQEHRIVLENCSTAKPQVVLCELQDMEIIGQLARMVHSEVLEPISQGPIAPWAIAWLGRMQYLNDAGIRWHHHLLFPHCQLSSYTEEWVLVFEDSEKPEPQIQRFASKPSREFGEIERLYWAQR